MAALAPTTTAQGPPIFTPMRAAHDPANTQDPPPIPTAYMTNVTPTPWGPMPTALARYRRYLTASPTAMMPNTSLLPVQDNRTHLQFGRHRNGQWIVRQARPRRAFSQAPGHRAAVDGGDIIPATPFQPGAPSLTALVMSDLFLLGPRFGYLHLARSWTHEMGAISRWHAWDHVWFTMAAQPGQTASALVDQMAHDIYAAVYPYTVIRAYRSGQTPGYGRGGYVAGAHASRLEAEFQREINRWINNIRNQRYLAHI